MTTDPVAAIRRPASPTTDWGTVVEIQASAGTLTVNVRGVALTLPMIGATYYPGDVVRIEHAGSSAHVTGRAGVPPPTPPGTSPSAPPQPVTSASTAIQPETRGTWRAGAWLSSPTITQGDWGWGNSFGAAYYGDALAALDADTTAGPSASLAMRRTRGGVTAASAPTMRLLTARHRAGLPAYSKTATGPSLATDAEAAWPVPADWVLDLLTGAAGGIGIYIDTGLAAGYQNYGEWAAQFVLTVNHKRKV